MEIVEPRCEFGELRGKITYGTAEVLNAFVTQFLLDSRHPDDVHFLLFGQLENCRDVHRRCVCRSEDLVLQGDACVGFRDSQMSL